MEDNQRFKLAGLERTTSVRERRALFEEKETSGKRDTTGASRLNQHTGIAASLISNFEAVAQIQIDRENQEKARLQANRPGFKKGIIVKNCALTTLESWDPRSASGGVPLISPRSPRSTSSLPNPASDFHITYSSTPIPQQPNQDGYPPPAQLQPKAPGSPSINTQNYVPLSHFQAKVFQDPTPATPVSPRGNPLTIHVPALQPNGVRSLNPDLLKKFSVEDNPIQGATSSAPTSPSPQPDHFKLRTAPNRTPLQDAAVSRPTFRRDNNTAPSSGQQPPREAVPPPAWKKRKTDTSDATVTPTVEIASPTVVQKVEIASPKVEIAPPSSPQPGTPPYLPQTIFFISILRPIAYPPKLLPSVMSTFPSLLCFSIYCFLLGTQMSGVDSFFVLFFLFLCFSFIFLFSY